MNWESLPIAATVAAFVTATFLSLPDKQGTNSLIGPIVWVINYGAATIISLCVWLVWAVLT